jgi:hypothetical protein
MCWNYFECFISVSWLGLGSGTSMNLFGKGKAVYFVEDCLICVCHFNAQQAICIGHNTDWALGFVWIWGLEAMESSVLLEPEPGEHTESRIRYFILSLVKMKGVRASRAQSWSLVSPLFPFESFVFTVFLLFPSS